MIYTPLTMKAMRIAYEAHHGQVDKSGLPYVLHPLHLAEQMTDEISTCAALLHDVAEDTQITLEQLQTMFPPEVTNAVALLTHADGVDYFDYVRAVGRDPVARRVKLADLAHNSDVSRLAGCAYDADRLQERLTKYRLAREILMAEGTER